MRKRMAMGVVYALIATGIGTWAACNGDMDAFHGTGACGYR